MLHDSDVLDFVNERPKLAKYPKIPYLEESPDLLGRECYVFEKIDGSLSQVRRTNSEIIGGSRSDYISSSSRRPYWGERFLKWMHSNHSLYNLKPGLVVYGEWLEPVTVEYDEDKLNKFYFLDLASISGDEIHFFDYEEGVDYLKNWGVTGIEFLNPIGIEFLTEGLVDEIVLGEPSYLKNNEHDDEMEGVVVKNYSLQKFAKKLHPNYSEIRNEEKTLEAKYVNEPRVQKAKRRILDRGDGVSLDSIVNEIKRDVKEESGIDFNFNSVRGVIRARNLFSDKE